jgi:hypothetical protein
MKLKSTRKPPKHDVWVTEVNVKDKKASKALQKFLMLVKKYEDLS